MLINDRILNFHYHGVEKTSTITTLYTKYIAAFGTCVCP